MNGITELVGGIVFTKVNSYKENNQIVSEIYFTYNKKNYLLSIPTICPAGFIQNGFNFIDCLKIQDLNITLNSQLETGSIKIECDYDDEISYYEFNVDHFQLIELPQSPKI